MLGELGGLAATWLAASNQRKQDREKIASELKAASRLIDEELRNAFDAAKAIRTGGAYVGLPTGAWDREGVRLAGASMVSLEDWNKIKHVYDAIHGLNWRVEAKVLEDETVRNASCDKITAATPAARDVLAKFTT